MGLTLIQTREAYKKRGSVCPALPGRSAGTLDAATAPCMQKLSVMHIHPEIHTDMYTDRDTHILYSCIHMQTHAQRQTLISAVITLTISRKQECIMFSSHCSPHSQIYTSIRMNTMLLWVWEVKMLEMVSLSSYLSNEAYILVSSRWSCEYVCVSCMHAVRLVVLRINCKYFLQGWQDPGCVCCRLSLCFWECRFYPSGTPV